jgi:uncharacterized protein YxeA
MTRTIKVLLGLILTAVAFCALFIWYTSHRPQQNSTSKITKAKDYVQAEAEFIKKKVDKNGLEHTIVEETNNVLPKNLMVYGEGHDKAFVDSLIAQTDIQKKEIVSLTQINQTIIGKNLQATAVIDSLSRRKFEFKDSNLYLSYTPDSDASIAGKFDYRYNQDLNLIKFNRKKWIFGEDHNYLDISSNDKKGTINGVKTLSVLQEENAFNAKLTAKSVFMPVSGNIAFGAQVRLRYKRLTATGSHLYFPSMQKWVPVAGLEYDLLNY